MELQSKIAYISVFTAASISIFVVESYIPQPIPGIRLGLANIFILLTIIYFGFKEGFLVGILKSFMGSLLLGRLLSPSFLFSISGTIMSVIIMWLAIKFGKHISLLGISILGAEIHTITQILLATTLFFPEASFTYLLPIYVLSALVAGSITGTISYWLFTKLERKIEIA
ncbi:MAG: Gx transporter family protein [candidate division WOR-3 bacterium]|nr:Gx transporter family protein [candidate division WOR-3 bacterium]